jgi:hypothetical protein
MNTKEALIKWAEAQLESRGIKFNQITDIGLQEENDSCGCHPNWRIYWGIEYFDDENKLKDLEIASQYEVDTDWLAELIDQVNELKEEDVDSTAASSDGQVEEA